MSKEEEAVKILLEYLGEDPNRDGLRDTPKRVVKSYKEMFSGYRENVEDVLTFFEDSCDEMVVLRNCEFVSFCEHHMLPFSGKIHCGYIPNQRVVGISKLIRVSEVFSKRLQIQERLTKQITEALDKFLLPLGSACVIEAKHSCMSCRGVRKQHSEMITSSLSGEFLKPEVRQEFMSLIRGRI